MHLLRRLKNTQIGELVKGLLAGKGSSPTKEASPGAVTLFPRRPIYDETMFTMVGTVVGVPKFRIYPKEGGPSNYSLSFSILVRKAFRKVKPVPIVVWGQRACEVPFLQSGASLFVTGNAGLDPKKQRVIEATHISIIA